MPKAIYILCAAASIACATVLIRAWLRNRARFLLWSGLCFSMLALNNLLLFLDLVVLPKVSGFMGLRFGTWRGLVAILGIAMLLWGIVFDVAPRPSRAPRSEADR